MNTHKSKLEYGDYQTPPELAEASCSLLKRLGVKPRSVLEPTCGVGHFLKAGLERMEGITEVRGFDIDVGYVEAARFELRQFCNSVSVSIEEANFFDTDWGVIVKSLPQPILVLGNPPWVTNSALGSVRSENLPAKSNFHRRSGLEALTGKSNFDISEYMLVHLSEAMRGRDATLAMLCKTAVARKVLSYCWKRELDVFNCHLFPINAQRSFGAAVNACLFVASFGGGRSDQFCIAHEDFDPESRGRRLGYRDGLLVSDLELYERWRFLRDSTSFVWRSGLKHDCAKVMEFSEQNGSLVNGLGETVQLEQTFLYPLLKSSALMGSQRTGSRLVLVTQRRLNEDTSTIARIAPRTWQYLLDHADWLDRRASVIYAKRPRFCEFGIGEYSFSPWKIVISGLDKRIQFSVVGPISGRPVFVDDTAYFLSCDDEATARLLAGLLNSDSAKAFLSSLVFWDAKRPITADLLSQISIERLSELLGKSHLLDLQSRDRQPQLTGLRHRR